MSYFILDYVCYDIGVMVERVIPLDVAYDSDDFREEMARVGSLDQFREFTAKVLPTISVNGFLYDFAAQIELRALMEDYAPKTKSDQETPVVILKENVESPTDRILYGGTTAIEPYRFRLHDIGVQHLYYFEHIPTQDPLTVRFLAYGGQEEQEHDIYPLSRVPAEGGLAYSFDYDVRLWQPNGNGRFRGIGMGNARMGDIRLPRRY
jgi:hypothetical protein